jgi:sec-independent protein translocase protein TatA
MSDSRADCPLDDRPEYPMVPQSPTAILAILGMPGGAEWIVILVIALLVFGRRLPEVGKSLGKGIVEFKKGIKGIEDEIEQESSNSKPAQIANSSSHHDPATGGERSPFEQTSEAAAHKGD